MTTTEKKTHKCPECGQEGTIIAADWWRGTTYDSGDYDRWGWVRLSCDHRLEANEYDVLTRPVLKLGKLT